MEHKDKVNLPQWQECVGSQGWFRSKVPLSLLRGLMLTLLLAHAHCQEVDKYFLAEL